MHVPFQVIEEVLTPVTTLVYWCTLLLILVAIIGIASDTNPGVPHYRQLTLPGFEAQVGYLPLWSYWLLTRALILFQNFTLERLFWTLATTVGCGAVTLVMSLISWVIHTYIYCPLKG